MQGIYRASTTTALAAFVLVSLPVFAQEKGELAFNNNCRTCHSIKPGENRLGPSLSNVFGKKAGSGTGYGSYSQGMVNAGIVWDDATLDKFITNPDSVVPNNNMKPFKGLSDPAVRKEIIDFLKSTAK